MLVNEKQSAEILSLSIKTLQGWRWRGEGPRFLKLGRAVRYRREDLTAYLDESLRSSTSERAGGGAR